MNFSLRSLNPFGSPVAGFATLAIVSVVSLYAIDNSDVDTPTEPQPIIVATNDSEPETLAPSTPVEPAIAPVEVDVEIAPLPTEPDPIIVAAIEAVEPTTPIDVEPPAVEALASAEPALPESNPLQELYSINSGSNAPTGEFEASSPDKTENTQSFAGSYILAYAEPTQQPDVITVTATKRAPDQQRAPIAVTSFPVDSIIVQGHKRPGYGRKARRERREAQQAAEYQNFGGTFLYAPSDEQLSPQVVALLEQQQMLYEADSTIPGYDDEGRDQFEAIETNPLKVSRAEPVSTFSIDVDTASYSFMRVSLNSGMLPQRDAVRIEELINYFPYDYSGPDDQETPFRAHVSVMPTPWNDDTKLMHVGIKGYSLEADAKPHSNLVFLIDTSGSMNAQNKLPLLVNSFKLLLDSLSPDDTVSIVVYAGSAGTVLEPTKVGNKAKIIARLDQLRSGGSTAGAAGIKRAYALAQQNYSEDGINRVILATDGDFNVGITNREELKSYIERKRDTGISLSVLGFGMGNYNDALMQTLAQNGNGNAAYIDNLSEARKVLVEEAGSTLFTIAKDVKIQVEFNPATVSEYRLIGYETRLLNREDFNNDKVDAGEIGAGHTVTAIYEITPVGSPAQRNDALRYQASNDAEETGASEYAFLKIRYKMPDSDTSTLITTPVTPELEVAEISDAPTDSRFAASVAAFGQLLRGGHYTGDYSYKDAIKLAKRAKGQDEFGYRAEFINLMRLARSAEER